MQEKRMIYPDILRIIATFAVIVLHITGGKWGTVTIHTNEWFVNNVYNGLTRWSVPIFVMVSGMFLLDPTKKITARDLWSKYIKRIGIAFIFWSMVYAIIVNLLKYKTINLFVMKAMMKGFLIGHYHLWFLPMIVGLYMITPFLRIITANASKRLLEYFLLLAFIFNFVIPTLIKFEVWEGIAIITGKFSFFFAMGYVGYFVAGYYFHTYPLTTLYRRMIYLLGFLALWATPMLTYIISQEKGMATNYFLSNYAPNVALTTVAIFIFFRNPMEHRQLSQKSSNRIKRLSSYTFTVYLFHELCLIFLAQIGISTSIYTSILSIPLFSAIIWLVSNLFAYGIQLKK